MLFFIFIATPVVCLLVHYLHWKLTGAGRPPGPYPWPFLGNLSWFLDPQKMPSVCNQLNNRYGPVSEIWLNNERFWVVCGSELRNLLKSNVMWMRWGDEEGMKEVGMYMEGIVMNNNLDDWKTSRRLFRTAVNDSGFLDQVRLVARQSVANMIRHVTKLASVTGDGGGGGVQLPVGEYCSRLAFDTTGQVSFGQQFDTVSGTAVDEAGLATKVKRFFNAWSYFLLTPPLVRSLQVRTTQQHRLAYQAVLHIQQQLIHDRVQGKSKSRGGDFLDAVLNATDSENPNRKLSERQAGSVVREMILGGTDTTSNSLAQLLWLLAVHPDVQQKMRQEIQAACAAAANAGSSPADVMKDCVYSQAVMKEANRLHITVPLIFRRPTEDYQIGDYVCPKGTNLLCNIGLTGVQRSGPEFNPDRWLTSEEPTKKKLTDAEAQFFPFGLGGRSCPGQHIALLELNIFVAELVSAFRLTTSTPLVVGWEVVNQVKPETMVTFTPINNAF